MARNVVFAHPVFVVSLSGYLLANETLTYEGIIAAIDGNICRCTGYKGIERAAEKIIEQVKADLPAVTLVELVANRYIPNYFLTIQERLDNIKAVHIANYRNIKLGGGTDLYVQRPVEMYETKAMPVYDHPSMNGIEIKDEYCTFGASETMGSLYRSEIF